MKTLPSPQDVNSLKTSGLNIHFEDSQGQVRMVINGITTARTPLDTTMFADRISYEFREIVKEKDATFVSLEHHEGHPYLLLKLRSKRDRNYELITLPPESTLAKSS